MPRNDAARSSHVCPHIRVHASDIVQPPGIGMRPIDDMDALQTIVAAALAVKSSAAMPKKTHCEARLESLRRDITFLLARQRYPRPGSALVVLVMKAPPDARLVAPFGGVP
jgi:hypothetical protein